MSFSFDEKIDFIDYCQNTLNLGTQCVSHSTLTHSVHNLYKKEKEIYKLFRAFDGRVSVSVNILSDYWQMHSYIGIAYN